MALFTGLILILLGIAFICAVLLGSALYYHFSQYSPDARTTTLTITVYSGGVALMALLTLIFVALI